jgi:hypothetical protein
MEYADERRLAEKAQEQAQREAQQAELLVEARTVIFDTKKAEMVAQKVLAQHSSQMKVALSELVVQTAEELRSKEIKPKDRAMAVDALKRVSERLYWWDLERQLELAELAEKKQANGAINLRLISLTPLELRELGEPKGRGAVESSVEVVGELVKEADGANWNEGLASEGRKGNN